MLDRTHYVMLVLIPSRASIRAAIQYLLGPTNAHHAENGNVNNQENCLPGMLRTGGRSAVRYSCAGPEEVHNTY